MILVSACLIGIKCRYDGSHAFCRPLMDWLQSQDYLPVCPEQLGGLTTPRPPSIIVGGSGEDVLHLKSRVINEKGSDVTFNFLKGAKKALEMAQTFGANVCLLKERSPSCGVNWIYTEQGLVSGMGVTTAMLLKNGYRVIGIQPGQTDIEKVIKEISKSGGNNELEV